MKKGKNKQLKLFFLIVFFCVSFGIFIFIFSFESKIKAYEVISTGDFRLTVENKWDDESKKNYVQLNWDAVSNVAETGYKLYQSADGSEWKSVSTNYKRFIKVLNVYPDSDYVVKHTGNKDYANTLKPWIDSLDFKDPSSGNPYIEIDSVRLSEFNLNPAAHLTLNYDVVYFGTFNGNGWQDTTEDGVSQIQSFASTGRGVLFGHDVVGSVNPIFNKLSSYVGIASVGKNASGNNAKVVNNGSMMKYPFELPNDFSMEIPWTHTSGFFYQNPAQNAIVWLSIDPATGTAYSNTVGYQQYYLATKDNWGLINTADHNADNTVPAGYPKVSTTEYEKKILANTLYNLAQVTMDTKAYDYTVKDDVAPDIPSVKLKCGTTDQFSVHISSNDKGKKYQWYVTADTKTGESKKSDTVEEEVISDIQGYIYTVDNSATTVPAVNKDEYGNVTNINASVELPNRTSSVYGIDAKNNKYMHVVAVDRANNVSEVKHVKLDTVEQYINYEVERTADEAKLVDLTLDSVISNKMQSIEIQIPQNTVIKDLSSMTLPTGWFSYQNSDANPAYQSFGFSMTTSNNDVATIQNFLESLRFTISSPTDQQGNIRIIFHEKIVTSWNEHPDGKIHYYSFFPGQVTWQEAYNAAKESTYKGMAGYLATITSFEEHSFIYNAIAKNPGWLGGSRMIIKEPASRINDEKVISKNQEDYDSSSNITWYWTNGPESGLVFYTGKTAKGGGFTPTGVYSGWDKRTPEPNNNWWNISEEYVLQFASQGSMYWNDLPSWIVNEPKWVQGYYVEFSEYGDQVEREEDTDLCWSAPIPQKVSLKAYDEEGASLSEGDMLYDQELRIGKEITVSPTVLDMYDFKELRNLDDTLHSPMTYTVGDTFQEGKLIYTNRKVSIHIRQVVTDPNTKVVVPKTGYGTVYSKEAASGVGVQHFPVYMGGDQSEAAQVFSDYVIRSSATEKYFSYQAILPEYYQLLGYVVSTEVPVSGTSTEHKVVNASTAVPTVNISENPEFWITTYITPTTEAPSFYGWGYGQSEKYHTVE